MKGLAMGWSRCLLTGLALAGWVTAAQAQVYSWQDQEGQRHFADHPPAGSAEHRTLDELPDLNNMQPPGASPYRPLPSPRPATGNATRAVEATTSRCESLERRLEAIQEQLRAGYGEPRGNGLRARRRELNAAYRHECREVMSRP
ncbi:DUF4124 domain-containing protein [Onishia taeanensis]